MHVLPLDSFRRLVDTDWIGMTESEHQSLQALLDRRDLHGALAYLAVLDNQTPKRASIQYHLGYVHRLLDQLDRAVQFYEAAIRLEPTTPLFHQALGIAFQQQGNYEAAVRAHEQAIELQPNYANAWNSLGLTHKMAGDMESALMAYKRAQELLVTSANLKIKAQRPEVIETHVLQSGERGTLVTAQYFVEIKQCLRSDLLYAAVMEQHRRLLPRARSPQ